MVISFGLLSSCIFFHNFQRETCTTNSDCFETFGEGSICSNTPDAEEGYCSLCDTNDDCIDAYGNGAICAAREGVTSEFEFVEDAEPKYCEVELNPITRCDTSFPDNIWDDWETYSDAIIIGQMFRGEADLSKTVATQIAIEQIQEAQDEDEKPIVSVLCNYSAEIDDGLPEEEAIKNIADHLGDEFGVNVIIGPSGSSATQTAIDHLDGRAVVISPSATSDTLTEEQTTESEDEPIMFWRTVAADTYQTAALSELIIAKGGENVGIIYTDSDYSRNIVEKIQENLPEEISTQAGLISDGTDFTDFLDGTDTDFTDVTSIVTISSNVEELQGMLTSILEYQTTGSDEKNYFFTDSAVRESVFTEEIRNLVAGNNTQIINRIWGTRPGISEEDPDFTLFNDIYSVEFSESLGETSSDYQYDANNNIYAAYSYDAMWLGALGALWSEYNSEGSAAGVSEGLGNISNSEASALSVLSSDNWSDIKEGFEEADSINISGASGSLDFDSESNQISSVFEIWRITPESNQRVETDCYVEDSSAEEDDSTSYVVSCTTEIAAISDQE